VTEKYGRQSVGIDRESLSYLTDRGGGRVEA